jgi:predicted carbohydrate-binding protein with CBM5 and CBM33 domain
VLVAAAGKATAVGSGAGHGYTINIPLPGDSGHDSMLAVWQRILAPAAHRFQPDLILCSAGKATAVLATADAGLPNENHAHACYPLHVGPSNCSCSC